MQDFRQDPLSDGSPHPDPNSPSRQQAAKYATYAKICFAVTILGFALLFLAIFLLKHSAPWTIFIFLPFCGVMSLGFYFQSKELKLRCTVRTTALCVETVRRHSGKTTKRHPIVEYEVDGTRYTAELSVSCTRHSVGETYTIYYDPLAPDTVRVGKKEELR